MQNVLFMLSFCQYTYIYKKYLLQITVYAFEYYWLFRLNLKGVNIFFFISIKYANTIYFKSPSESNRNSKISTNPRYMSLYRYIICDVWVL